MAARAPTSRPPAAGIPSTSTRRSIWSAPRSLALIGSDREGTRHRPRHEAGRDRHLGLRRHGGDARTRCSSARGDRAARPPQDRATSWPRTRCEVVVVGLPLSLDGSDRTGRRSGRSLRPGHLHRAIPVTVETYDERLTTVTADRVLRTMDLSAPERRRVVDKVAAAVILQGWLDRNRERPTSIRGTIGVNPRRPEPIQSRRLRRRGGRRSRVPARRGPSRTRRTARGTTTSASRDDEYVVMRPRTRGGPRLDGRLRRWSGRDPGRAGRCRVLGVASDRPRRRSRDRRSATLEVPDRVVDRRHRRPARREAGRHQRHAVPLLHRAGRTSDPGRPGSTPTSSENMSFDEAITVLDAGPDPAQDEGRPGDRGPPARRCVGVDPRADAERLRGPAQRCTRRRARSRRSTGPRPTPTNWEGFLFPDTYQFQEDATADDRSSRRWPRRWTTCSTSSATTRPRRCRAASAYDLITTASLVEKEAGQPADERGKVARVIYNRLDANEPLGIDAALLYGLGRSGGELTKADLETDTPYNNRKKPGLPPTPIAPPGQGVARRRRSSPRRAIGSTTCWCRRTRRRTSSRRRTRSSRPPRPTRRPGVCSERPVGSRRFDQGGGGHRLTRRPFALAGDPQRRVRGRRASTGSTSPWRSHPAPGAQAVAAMRTLGLGGMSVTTPHKADVIAALDDVTDDARRLGAVNCIAADEDGPARRPQHRRGRIRPGTRRRLRLRSARIVVRGARRRRGSPRGDPRPGPSRCGVGSWS